MTVRDLGYRAYEGDRLPPSNNTWVMLRHGMKRIWSWWVIIIAIFACGVPAGGALIGAAVELGFFTVSAGPGGPEPLAAASWLRWVLGFQTWVFVTLLTLLSGAGVIAQDFTNKAFQFYFAKPVTPIQYLIGRIGAIALSCMTMLAPTLLMWIAFLASAPEDLRTERGGLILPLLLHAALISFSYAACAVGISSISKSRALTISAWMLLLIVPAMIAWIVNGLADWPWLYLASLPELLGTVGDALFKIENESALKWYHAAPFLAGMVGLALWGASERVKRAEVIT